MRSIGYYLDWTDEEFLANFDSGMEFGEEVKWELIDGCWGTIVETKRDEDTRWYAPMTTYIKIKDRYIAQRWYHGLTELQDSEVYDDPYEVIPHEKEITITVRDWEKV